MPNRQSELDKNYNPLKCNNISIYDIVITTGDSEETYYNYNNTYYIDYLNFIHNF